MFLFVFPTLGMYSTSKNKGVQNRLLGSSKVESGSQPSSGVVVTVEERWPLTTGAVKGRRQEEETTEPHVSSLATSQPMPHF